MMTAAGSALESIDTSFPSSLIRRFRTSSAAGRAFGSTLMSTATGTRRAGRPRRIDQPDDGHPDGAGAKDGQQRHYGRSAAHALRRLLSFDCGTWRHRRAIDDAGDASDGLIERLGPFFARFRGRRAVAAARETLLASLRLQDRSPAPLPPAPSTAEAVAVPALMAGASSSNFRSSRPRRVNRRVGGRRVELATPIRRRG